MNSPYRPTPQVPAPPPKPSMRDIVIHTGLSLLLLCLAVKVATTSLAATLSLIGGGICYGAALLAALTYGQREERLRTWRERLGGAPVSDYERISLDPVVVHRVIAVLNASVTEESFGIISSALDELRRDLAYAQMIAELDRKRAAEKTP